MLLVTIVTKLQLFIATVVSLILVKKFVKTSQWV